MNRPTCGQMHSRRYDVPAKTIGDFQAEVDAWIQAVGGGYWSPHANLARIAEEVGELARLINHLYGPKPKKPGEAAQELGEELADIVFAIICLANSQDIDLGTSLHKVLEKVWDRDRHRYIASS
jgi:NTP pyrophosphatase (non-canonical NTP hydrolase)